MSDATAASGTPWQLKMFSKTLKKQLKLALLLRQAGPLTGKQCLLITNGDNNGALNYKFREAGGHWTWVENEVPPIAEMEELLGEKVLKGEYDHIPVEDASFDTVISIDVHEHIADCSGFNSELHRVTKPGGTIVVTTPNGGWWKPLNIVKKLVGMTPEKYGHVDWGYTISQHKTMLSEVGIEPQGSGSYSKFFTEFLELLINFAFVMVLSRKQDMNVEQGQIAPSSQDQLKKVEKQYKMYALVYPVLKAVSSLDALFFFFTGYAVSVVAKRPA